MGGLHCLILKPVSTAANSCTVPHTIRVSIAQGRDSFSWLGWQSLYCRQATSTGWLGIWVSVILQLMCVRGRTQAPKNSCFRGYHASSKHDILWRTCQLFFPQFTPSNQRLAMKIFRLSTDKAHVLCPGTLWTMATVQSVICINIHVT